MSAKSALILGGGIIGLTCAHQLRELGFEAVVADPENALFSASLGNAGHLAVEQAAPLASHRSILQAPRRLFALGGALDFPLGGAASWAPFAARFIAASSPRRFMAGERALAAWLKEAMPAWRRLLQSLSAEKLLMEQGHFVVWESKRSAERGIEHWKGVSAETATFRPATNAELAQISDRVRAPVADGIWFDQSGQIANLHELQKRLRETIASSGGEFVKDTANEIAIDNRVAKAVFASGETRKADIILIAAGVESGCLMRTAGHRAPLIAERGYHLEGATDAWPAFPPVVFEDRSLIATRFSDALRLASFVELSNANAAPDPAKWRRLRRHAAELGVAFSEPAREWMGARPTFPDYLPAVGRSARAGNLFYAFGHQHLGLTLAPITAEILAQIACAKPAALDIEPFDLARFD